MKSLKKGFTLIELLVVIAIIAILATVVILNVSQARVKAADAKAKDETAEIAKAVQACALDAGAAHSSVTAANYATSAASTAVCTGTNLSITINYPATQPNGWAYSVDANGYMQGASGTKAITCNATSCSGSGGGNSGAWY